jgi:hypothetical protein
MGMGGGVRQKPAPHQGAHDQVVVRQSPAPYTNLQVRVITAQWQKGPHLAQRIDEDLVVSSF